MKINLKYIEGAIGYNSASTEGYAKRKIIELLDALLKGDSIVIKNIGVVLKPLRNISLGNGIENI